MTARWKWRKDQPRAVNQVAKGSGNVPGIGRGLTRPVAAGKQQKGRMFFFEKKEPKNFYYYRKMAV
jgi:hypothetical protein